MAVGDQLGVVWTWLAPEAVTLGQARKDPNILRQSLGPLLFVVLVFLRSCLLLVGAAASNPAISSATWPWFQSPYA